MRPRKKSKWCVRIILEWFRAGISVRFFWIIIFLFITIAVWLYCELTRWFSSFIAILVGFLFVYFWSRARIDNRSWPIGSFPSAIKRPEKATRAATKVLSIGWCARIDAYRPKTWRKFTARISEKEWRSSSMFPKCSGRKKIVTIPQKERAGT